MVVIVCLDDRNGMLFNNRRVSRDRFVIEDIIENIDDKLLLINSFSAELFEKSNNITICDDFLDIAKVDDYCFVENVDIKKYIDAVDNIIVYRWNRNYPYDQQFTIDLSKWNLIKKNDFKGYSHEIITKEIYIK